MKAALLLIALVASTPAFGRIGETSDQLRKRYGRPLATMHDYGETRLYSFHGFTVLVGFDKGISQCEIYQKADRSRMSEAEIRGLLAANAVTSPWRDEPEESTTIYLYWSQDKKSRVAIYSLTGHTLTVTSKAFLKRFGQLIKSIGQKEIDGF